MREVLFDRGRQKSYAKFLGKPSPKNGQVLCADAVEITRCWKLVSGVRDPNKVTVGDGSANSVEDKQLHCLLRFFPVQRPN